MPCRCLRSSCAPPAPCPLPARALPALCLRSAAFLSLSSFKTAPAALAACSLICRTTPRLPALPQPQQGARGGTGTPRPLLPRGGPPVPAPSIPGVGAQMMGWLLLPIWGISRQEEVCWGEGGICVSGAARWKKPGLGVLQKYPCTLEMEFWRSLT